ncbi:putative Cytochrome P450 [Melia azedarach]|uniref:Cytochrome P450 n=1 Tax=Melia azedarach TaxID=155640 RepID=A0ACC1YLP6_MELAZ|nr:putative Cytochrome P450 [Melia azedarach]
MEMLNLVLWFLSTCVLAIALTKSFSRGTKAAGSDLPPGPSPFAVIGNLLELGDKPHNSLAKLSHIYGPIMSLKFGQVTTIVISSGAMAKEILQNYDTSFYNRPIPDALQAHQHSDFAMVWLPVSTPWRNLRKICNSHIFSIQKLDASQDLRRKEIQQLLAYVKESCCAGKAIDISQVAFNASLNFLSKTMFSVDLADPSSDAGREFKQIVRGVMVEAGKPNLGDYFPMLRKLDLQGRRRRMTTYFGKMLEIFDLMIDQRLNLRQEHGLTDAESRDMLDTLLNTSEENSNQIDKNSIKHLFVELFAAGTETTSSTLEWAMTEVIRKPEALLKAKLEIEETIGKGKPVEESDVIRLPYLQAVVKETFRLHPPAPLLLPRKASEDVTISGFTVPKGAQIFVNAWAIGRDASTWDNPNSFMPERFLESDIDVKGRHFELIPFGGGRRICPGLPLAIRMLYPMLGSLINSFDWKLEDGVTPENMDMEEKFGITLRKAKPLRLVPTFAVSNI